MIGCWAGLCALCALVGFDGDLRTPSLSMAELWILNKSMPSDWTPEPLLNENHCSEISILPPLPPLPVSRLYLSHCFFLFFFRSFSFLSPLVALRPLENTRICTHTHIHLKLVFCMPLLLFFSFLLRQPNVRPSSDGPLCAEALLVQSASVTAGKTMLPSRVQQCLHY